jgi:uncharacterized membrane protein YecN with MAPEG domain
MKRRPKRAREWAFPNSQHALEATDMTGSITALYAGILALLIVALGISVTVHRVKLGVSLGDGDNPQMLRMIRLHGNAVEYIPIALVLMLVYEINGGWHMALHAAGVALVIGRLLQTDDGSPRLCPWRRSEPNVAHNCGAGRAEFAEACLS